MKNIKFLTLLLVCACLLAAAPVNFGRAWAANPDKVWQDYQNNPDVSTEPHKSTAPQPAPHITVEDKNGQTVEPSAPEQLEDESTVKAATPLEKKTEAATAAKEAQPAAQVKTPPQVSNVPTNVKPKPKPKRQLVQKPPLPKMYMRIPQAMDFVSVNSAAGGYSLALPKAFGADPLADLPGVQDVMLTRIADDSLLCAAATFAAADADGQNKLPDYADDNKKVLLRWQHGVDFIWDCCLSEHVDFYGEKIILEAKASQNNKTYQLLYVLPKKSLNTYVPQALQSLDSFATAN
ncbi:hypothetical protein [uncultured Phascolarctobacterium sp.]|uniref:hypothetical protein n=1 Tax=uncultured Phascolarctobacterium sp. TaxID=512296 RepID=UPI002610967D|nr:hypothetical protein [uncultured Phascolarctobacterium sp.]